MTGGETDLSSYDAQRTWAARAQAMALAGSVLFVLLLALAAGYVGQDAELGPLAAALLVLSMTGVVWVLLFCHPRPPRLVAHRAGLTIVPRGLTTARRRGVPWHALAAVVVVPAPLRYRPPPSWRLLVPAKRRHEPRVPWCCYDATSCTLTVREDAVDQEALGRAVRQHRAAVALPPSLPAPVAGPEACLPPLDLPLQVHGLGERRSSGGLAIVAAAGALWAALAAPVDAQYGQGVYGVVFLSLVFGLWYLLLSGALSPEGPRVGIQGVRLSGSDQTLPWSRFDWVCQTPTTDTIVVPLACFPEERHVLVVSTNLPERAAVIRRFLAGRGPRHSPSEDLPERPATEEEGLGDRAPGCLVGLLVAVFAVWAMCLEGTVEGCPVVARALGAGGAAVVAVATLTVALLRLRAWWR